MKLTTILPSVGTVQTEDEAYRRCLVVARAAITVGPGRVRALTVNEIAQLLAASWRDGMQHGMKRGLLIHDGEVIE